MPAKNIWTAGVAGTALVSLFGLLAVLPKMEADLKYGALKALAEAGVADDLDLKVSGQDIVLSPKAGLADAAQSVKSAQNALAGLKIPNRPNLPSGDWLKGPIAALQVSTLPSSSVTSTTAQPSAQDVALTSQDSAPATSASVSGTAQVAISEAAQSCEAKIASTLESHKLAFRFGTYQLDRPSLAVIDKVYQTMASCPTDLKFVVQGHTDSVGASETNRLISLARAEAAANALVVRGLAQDRISYEGLGADQPIADNVTYRGRALNRRVVFKVKAQ